jgi:quinol monooxygenase YgiN
MPALPWFEAHAVDPNGDYVAMASRLPLKSYLSIPGFLRDVMELRRQLAHTPGLVGYALDAQLVRKTFWTFSVWDDQASIDAFAATDPHQRVTPALRPRMRTTQFEFFPIAGNAFP